MRCCATPAMLAQVRALADAQGLGNLSWREASAYALPFASGSFDIVCSRFALHHLEPIEDAFAEMLRVARPGAQLLPCDGVADDDPAGREDGEVILSCTGVVLVATLPK